MRIEDLTPDEQATANELDGIALRFYGPRTYALLNEDERAECVWQSLRELCETFTPPFDPGPRPEGWKP